MSDIERQEDTVLRALAMLKARPGLVLADEVGMGKTYEALGVAAATRHANPKSRIVVVTPGPDLNTKWSSEFARFREMYDFGADFKEVGKLSQFVQAVRKHPIVVAPVTMFQSGRGWEAQHYLLSLYFYWSGLHGNTINAILSRYYGVEMELANVEEEKFLNCFSLDNVRPHLERAFRKGRDSGRLGLDDLYEKHGGIDAFADEEAVRRALYRARFVLTGRLMPLIDLLIVDEAHKLKNPLSLRTQGMRRVFDRRFKKALFLTATPFQLEVGELRKVFSLFSVARNAPEAMSEELDELLLAIRDYQRQYEEFQSTWSALDPVTAAEVRNAYDRDEFRAESLDDPTVELVARQIARLRDLKNSAIEPGLRRWMIRSLRTDKRIYRSHKRIPIPNGGARALPFLIYERYIAELFRRRRQTHKAAVEINMVSSYAAAWKGAILSEEGAVPDEAEQYRELLRDVLGGIQEETLGHPKLAHSVDDALSAATRGEKTLIFCSRIATLERLRQEIDEAWEERLLERWQQVYRDAHADDIFDRSVGRRRHRGRHSNLQARFHRPQDALYLALREPYLLSLEPVAEWAGEHLGDVVMEANRILRSIRLGKTAAERLDYQVAKRCVEQASLSLWRAERERRSDRSQLAANILHPKFLRLGLDLSSDSFEKDPGGRKKPQWEISERVAGMALEAGRPLWGRMTSVLAPLDPVSRVKVVEQLARFLTYKQVPFLSELLVEATAADLSVDPVESAPLVEFMPHFWSTPTGRSWIGRLSAFLEYFVERSAEQQHDILEGPMKTGDLVRHTRDGESRERLREAFNTPLYPMILIANEVMQEGLDLHKHCRRVSHHDLLWNPAQIEQRIGRIDRLGSLTSRLRGEDTTVKMDILYPIIRGTIDERLYRTVKTREKWLEFLLGAAPNFSEYSLTDEEPPLLPDKLGADLSIDLGPR